MTSRRGGFGRPTDMNALKILLFCLLASLTGTYVWGIVIAHADHHINDFNVKLLDAKSYQRLKLSEEQKGQILDSDFVARKELARALDDEPVLAGKVVEDQYNDELRNILTPEQSTLYFDEETQGESGSRKAESGN